MLNEIRPFVLFDDFYPDDDTIYSNRNVVSYARCVFSKPFERFLGNQRI